MTTKGSGPTREQRREVTTDELEAGIQLETGRKHVLVWVRHTLHIRLPIDPRKASSWDDRFTLIEHAADGMLRRQARSVKDDHVPGDAFVDLIYRGLRRGRSYSLEVDPGAEGDPYLLFEEIPFDELYT